MGDIFWTANWSVKFLETSYGSGVGHFDSANSGFASFKKGKLRDSSILGSDSIQIFCSLIFLVTRVKVIRFQKFVG